MQHKLHVFFVCVTGIFVTVFDTSSAIVALPTIALELGTDLPTAQWVIIGNSLTIAALLVPLGRLSDSVGRKRIYVVGCCLFSAGALLAALAGGIGALIAARIFVGIGSAMTQSTAMALLISSYEADERAKVLGWQMGGVGLGAIAGPATGGIIVGTVGWRALFAITAVAMIVIALAAQLILRRRAERPRSSMPPFDFRGAALFSSLLAASLLTLTLAPRFGWTGPYALAGYAAVAVLGWTFIRAERRHPAPMMDLRLFRVGAFGLGALSAVIAFMGVSSTRFLTPFFLQGVKGFDPSGVGLLMLPAAAVTAVAGPLINRFADRFGVRLFANAGIGIALLGLLQFARLDTSSPVWAVVAALMTMALGLATFSASNSTLMLNAVDAGSHGFASGFVNLCRNTGNVIGIAFATAMVALTMSRAGYVATVGDLGPAADGGTLEAFTRGIRAAAGALLLLTAALWVALLTWSRRSGAGRSEAVRAGEARSGVRRAAASSAGEIPAAANPRQAAPSADDRATGRRSSDSGAKSPPA
ncbi:MAG: MFS transporter [Gammaproteobacteria bacterium]|nr:MFS transporter [Gammaproteobacteria bacterium]